MQLKGVTSFVTTAATVPEVRARRPKRADAARNYEALLNAAREAFGEGGVTTSLEDIARRAGVGIGTLYRHFPTRQDLLEAVYVNEVETLCRSAADLHELPPWDALVSFLNGVVGYASTKKAIAEELTAAHGQGSEFFQACRTEIRAAGEPLLTRAQQAGAARGDVTFDDVLRMIAGLAAVAFPAPEDRDRVLLMAFDGLRTQPV